MAEVKTCKTCKITKSVDEFHKYRGSCKICYNLSTKDKCKKYYEDNKSVILSKLKNIYHSDKELFNSKSREYYRLNRDNILKKERIKYHSDKGAQKIKNKKNYIKNRINWRTSQKNYISMRMSEPLFRLKANIRSSIYHSVKRNGLRKKSTTQVILGCSFEYLKIYLESKFEPWMTWDNHGKYNGEFNYGWDIDHIIPLSLAKSEDELIKLNHYTNLQPLCSKVNRDIKKDKIQWQMSE